MIASKPTRLAKMSSAPDSLYAPQSNILQTEITTAQRVAKIIFDRDLAGVRRPKDLRAFLESQLYRPEHSNAATPGRYCPGRAGNMYAINFSSRGGAWVRRDDAVGQRPLVAARHPEHRGRRGGRHRLPSAGRPVYGASDRQPCNRGRALHYGSFQPSRSAAGGASLHGG